MTGSRLRPKVVLWWGIVLTIGGMLLTTFLPVLGYAVTGTYNTSSGVDQGMLTSLQFVLQLIGQVVPPLGVALIGASVVMAYVARLLPARTPAAESVLSTDHD